MRLAGSALASLAVAIAGACSSFSSGSDDSTGSNVDASVDSPSATPPPAPVPPPPGPKPDSGALVDDQFEGDCGEWTIGSGATMTFVTGAGLDGGGACLVYVPPNGEVRETFDTLPAGTYELTAMVRD